MFTIILLTLLGLGCLVGAVYCCGAPRIEQAQRMAGVKPGRKTPGRL